jgi:DNA-directed RNA polymerase specialized sigma24 family protein
MEPRKAGNELPLSPRLMEEKQWARKVREEGDRHAFEKIFRSYYKRLHGFAYSYVGQAETAEDIVQTVFLKIWSQKGDWESARNSKTIPVCCGSQ